MCEQLCILYHNMDSEFDQQQYEHHFQEFPRQYEHPRPQSNNLSRFSSAPSSYFASFLDVAGDGAERRDFANARPLSPETENIFNKFMSSIGANESSSSCQKLSNVKTTERVKQETDFEEHKIYHSQSKPPLSKSSSMGIAAVPHSMKTGLGGAGANFNMNMNRCPSSLTRYSSSPAGFFDNLNMDAGFGMMGSGISTSDLMNQNSITSSSWDADSVMSEDSKTFISSQNQSAEELNRPPRLAHHLSLPKTLPELENFLNSQDTVPCRIRAKRGCATHPRSIAERVRRTKISQRMRKLQDLVPNMDKQTNTADMLDLAVHYIKHLQKQVETLADNRAQCTCSR